MQPAAASVFLSYASQDGAVAQRIAAALEAAGVPVWLDRTELRGGDAWDAMIRERIRDCALFVPVVSATTEQRAEGYFRLEWRLAVERAGRIADDVPFLLPLAVTEVAQEAARVPARFRDVQWSAMRNDEDLRRFATRVAAILGGPAAAAPAPRIPSSLRPSPNDDDVRDPASAPASQRPEAGHAMPASPGSTPGAAGAAIASPGSTFGGAGSTITSPGSAFGAGAPTTAPPGTTQAPPEPPAMSLALQALGGSDAAAAADVTRDLTGMLTRSSTLVRVVPVPAHGVPTDLGELARAFGVRHVAQGVLRDGSARLDVWLSDGLTRQQLWSESFTLPADAGGRDSVLRTASWRLSRAQIAAEQRRVLGQPTERDTAVELVVRALALDRSEPSLAKRIPQKLALLDEALRREPHLASALVGTAIALYQQLESDLAPDRDTIIRQLDEVTGRAIRLAEMHPAPWVLRATSRMVSGRWQSALEASARALRLEPQSMGLLEVNASMQLLAGRAEEALRILDAAAALDPAGHHDLRGTRCLVLLCLGRTAEAIDAAEPVCGALPDDPTPDTVVAAGALRLGDRDRAAAALEDARRREPRLSVRYLRRRQLSVQPDFLRQLEEHLLAPLRELGLAEE